MSEIDDPESDSAEDRSAELDGLKIQQLAALRRAAYRSRSHAVIAMLVCAVAVVQAGILLVQHLLHIGIGPRVPVYAGFVLVGVYGTIFFMRRAIALHREARQSHLDSPSIPPDFSSLDDGSQRWKNLEDLK
jgi:hypothetical protein